MTKLTLILTLNDPHDAYEEIVFRDSNEENFNDSVHTLRAPDNIKHTGVYRRRFQLVRIQASPAVQTRRRPKCCGLDRRRTSVR